MAASKVDNKKHRYAYLAKSRSTADSSGVRKGIIVARDEYSARRELEEKYNLFVHDLELINDSVWNRDFGSILGSRAPKTKDIARWVRQFATLFRSGIPVVDVLGILSTQGEDKKSRTNQRLAEATKEIQRSIKEGEELAPAMRQHPDIFPPFVIAMIAAGEVSGKLELNMAETAKALESEVRLKAKIKSALTYPVVVLILAVLIVTGLLLFIVPMFSEMFASLGGSLPLPTQILVSLSAFMKIAWLPIAVVIGVLIYLFKKNKNKPAIRERLDPLKLKLPIFGELFRKVAVARFSRNLSTLLESGVPILDALRITSDTVNSVPFSEAILEIRKSVERGESMSQPMKEHAVFPHMATQMVVIGEAAGNPEEMLANVADTYDEEVEITTESLTSLVEPLMIVFLGIIVGGIVISLYLPLFKIYDLIS